MTLPHATQRDVHIPGTDTTVTVPVRDLPSVGALLVFVTVGYITGGPTGGITAVTAALIALVVPVVVGFSIGQLALLTMVTVGDLLWLVVTQLSLIVLLTEPARERNVSNVTVVTLVAFGLLAGVVGAGLQRSPAAAAAGLGLAVAAGLYVTHRYERVRLGLVSGGSESTPTSNADDSDETSTSTTST